MIRVAMDLYGSGSTSQQKGERKEIIPTGNGENAERDDPQAIPFFAGQFWISSSDQQRPVQRVHIGRHSRVDGVHATWNPW